MEDNKERKFMIKAHLREKNNGFLGNGESIS